MLLVLLAQDLAELVADGGLASTVSPGLAAQRSHGVVPRPRGVVPALDGGQGEVDRLAPGGVSPRLAGQSLELCAQLARRRG